MMRRLIHTAGVLALVSFVHTACGRTTEQPPAHDTPASAATSVEPRQPLQISARTEPAPPKSGATSIEATVKGADGQPVTDAEVSAAFYMPAMPEMKMAEMRNTIALTHQEGGRYRGQGALQTAGKWDVTVTVKRGGKEIGKQTIMVTAQ